MVFDAKDRQILQCLQENSRMTASEISSRVGISIPTVSERIHRLQESGIITAFSTEVDARKLGIDLLAFITTDSSSSEHYEEFVIHARKHRAIQECHSITGGGSHLLKVRARNSAELEKILREIQRWPGVVRTHTMIVLSTYKESSALDLGESMLPTTQRQESR